MLKRKSLFRKKKFYLLLGVIIIFVNTFVIWNYSDKNNLLRNFIKFTKSINIAIILDYTILPINGYFNSLVNPPKHLTDLNSLNQELRKLKQELFFKQREIDSLKRLREENNYLRKFLGYQSNSSISLVPARVISYEPQNHFTSFWINAGKKKNISNSMPVIGFNSDGKQGLVGYIEKTTYKNSIVRTILDPQSHVGVLIQKYQSRGILRGGNHLNRLLSVDYINNELTNLNNLNIITSDIGGRYPLGIQVGKIIDSQDSIYGLFKKIIVKPSIDFTSLKDVFVLMTTNR